MKPTAKEFLSQPRKAVTLIGMSGVGKSYLAAKLAGWGWYNYSCDYLIGTEYLADAIKSKNEMRPENIANLSEFVGQIGDPAQGGTGVEEFRRRQRLYYEAECRALEDLPKGLARAEGNFIHDSAGSLCEIEEEALIAGVGAQTLFVYLKVPEEEHGKILERAVQYPKPLYFPPAFFDERLAMYKSVFDVKDEGAIDPADFLSWVFPYLFEARLPKYRALAEKYGVTIPAGEITNIESAEEFIGKVAEALGK